jgi:hypothetical protein
VNRRKLKAFMGNFAHSTAKLIDPESCFSQMQSSLPLESFGRLLASAAAEKENPIWPQQWQRALN